METQSIRIRLIFDDCSVLSLAQRSHGMNHSWILIEPNQHPKISDVCSHLLHKFNLRSSCPNGILLFMEDFVLPPSESTRILKDNDIIRVKRKGVALGEAIEGIDACNNLLNEEVKRAEHVDNGMLLLANEEFDKETGGYQSESEDAEVEEPNVDPSPKETTSKKRKASSKLRSSKKKKHRLVVTNGVEDEVAIEDDGVNNEECISMKITNKKIKPNKKKSGESETITEETKSSSKKKRKKKHRPGVVIGDEDEAVTGELADVNNGESLIKKKISKKKTKQNEESKMENAETSDKDVKVDVEGVKQTSTAPDGGEKAPSRSTRRKKAKRKWRLEQAKSSQNASVLFKVEPETRVETEISKTENKEATGCSEGPLKKDQVVAKVTYKNTIDQEGKNYNENGVTKLVPCVIRPGHIRFKPLDEEEDEEDTEHTEVPDVGFKWNGIISKKKGQKWGLEKFSTSKRDASQNATEEPSPMLTVEVQAGSRKTTEEPSAMLNIGAQVPLVDLNAFDQLPLCSSPKEGDVIAYRVLELSSSWTPELSSYRVGKISYYDADNIVLMPVPEYPIVFDKTDEDGPENSLYKEDGSLEIKFADLSDVRSFDQRNSDAVKGASNGGYQTEQVDEKNVTSNLISINNSENLSKDPSPVVGNKVGNAWDEIEELLSAKKSELLETNDDSKRDSGWNKWSYRALRGSALGPTMSLLRSENDI